MSLQKQQNFLAKLYTDAEFRRAFLKEPGKIGAENDLSEKETAEIAEIMPEELNFFADSLVGKRLREAEKFLPLTKKILGGDFSEHFREFSQKFNPQSIKKHLEDAVFFCRFLRNQKISEIAANAAKFEQSKLEFFGLEKRLVVCRLEYDFRRFNASGPNAASEAPEKKKNIAVWFRAGKRIKHFFIQGLPFAF